MGTRFVCRLPLIARRSPIGGCCIPDRHGECLPECRKAGSCRALVLRLVDGRTFVGRPLGALGDTLRFRAVWPEEGPVLLPFTDVEPLSLHESLESCEDPRDGEAILRAAEICAARGLLDLALRELDRAMEASPGLGRAVRERRRRLVEEASRRGLTDAREHLEAGRPDHARAALDEVLRRFPRSEAARDARALRRTIARRAAAG